MDFVTAHRRLCFWTAASIIAFALSFILGAVWREHQPRPAAVAYVDGR